MSAKIVTVKNIEEILEKHEIVFLDFWASWCEPCKVFGPIFESVAKKNPDVFFGKVNTETEHDLSNDFAVRSIPTLVVMKNRTIIYSEAGMKPEYMLQKMVEDVKKINVDELETEDESE